MIEILRRKSFKQIFFYSLQCYTAKQSHFWRTQATVQYSNERSGVAHFTREDHAYDASRLPKTSKNGCFAVYFNVGLRTRSVPHFVYDSFQLFFYGRFLRFKSMTRYFFLFFIFLLFTGFKIRLIRSYTPLTYGIKTHAFGLSQSINCVLFG